MTSKLNRRTRAGLTAFAVLASILVAPSTPAAAPDACVPRAVAGLGNACQLPNGLYRITLINGATVLTHGPDPLPLEATRPQPQVTSAQASVWPGQVKPQCIKDPNKEFHGHVIYARAADRPDRYTKLLTEVRAMVNIVNGTLRTEARRFDRRMDFRMLCLGSNVKVSRVKLSTTHETTNLNTIINDLLLQGYSDARAKYWIWYDGRPPLSPAGIGTIRGDSSESAENINNYGQSWSVTYGLRLTSGGPHTMMHEATHNLGGVQQDSPNTSGSPDWHCIDDQDVMCYPDGGGRAHLFRANICTTERYDCNNNDYFNPRPKSGSYISKHWNLGSPLNHWIAGCQFTTGTLTAPNPTQVSDPKLLAVRGVSRSCWGRPFAVSGVSFAAYARVRQLYPLAADAAEFAHEVALGSMLRRYPADFSVCFFKGSKQLRCYERLGTESGLVPTGATRMRIWITEGVEATYFFNAV